MNTNKTISWICSNCRFAMPLPKANGYPPKGSGDSGLESLDKAMTNDQAEEVSFRHPDMKYIGHGMYGVAYDAAPPGTVIKITRDVTEAIAAKKLKEKPCPCVVKVFNVSEVLKGTSRQSIWKLSLEKVEPLSEEAKKYVDFLSQFVFDSVYPSYPSFEFVLNEVKQRPYYLKNPDWINNLESNYNAYAKMVNCLRSNGFYANDAHRNNVGVRGNDYVMMDLGGLSVPQEDS